MFNFLHIKGLLTDGLNGALRRFQQYFTHIMATAHIIHVFSVFHQGSEVSCPRTLPQKTQRIRCGSNSLAPSHAGPLQRGITTTETTSTTSITTTTNITNTSNANPSVTTKYNVDDD